MALITIDTLRGHLKLPSDVHVEDAELNDFIRQAEDMVLGYIARPDDDEQAAMIAAWTTMTVPASVSAAVLKMAMAFWRYRDEPIPESIWENVAAILQMAGYRRPVAV